MDQNKKRKIGSLLLRLAGWAALGFAIFTIVSNTLMWMTGESTKGQVIGWEYMEGIRDRRNVRRNIDPAKAYVITFQTQIGDTVIFTTDVGSGMDWYETGDEVTVIYYQDQPEQAKLRSFASLYLGPCLLIVLGLVFVFVGILLS